MGEQVGPKEGKLDLEGYYKSSLVNLAQALIDAISVSQATRGIPSRGNGRQFWASVLFARMCGIGVSLQCLLPGSASSGKRQHWDSTGCLALCRSVFEAYLAMFYLCTDQMTDADYELRIHLMFLHDANERPRIVGKISTSDLEPKVEEFHARECARLRDVISKNAVFVGLPKWKQKRLLEGKTPYYLSQDELLQKQGQDATVLRGIWELLSSHVHSYPFSFYRAAEQKDRGTGRENEIDKAYCGLAAEQTVAMLRRATDDMKKLFPEVSNIPRCTIDWDTLTSYPTSEASHGFIFGMANPRPR